MEQNRTTIVIFGGTGDLTKKKLIEALQVVSKTKDIDIVGFARRDYTDETFRETFKDEIPDADEGFFSHIFYHQGEFNTLDNYETLKARLKSDNLLFYLAVAPTSYEVIINNLASAKLNVPSSRIIIEKPFGEDKESARELYKSVTAVFEDSQVYIIDHYLGKETIQNILAFRFSNGIFEHIWNNQFVDSIQITSAENFGTEGRGGYYDKAGATKDMIQSHILQILAAVAMEPPKSFEPDDIHTERTKLISSLLKKEEHECDEVVFGQYEGYTDDDKVAKDSKTETFTALRTYIQNQRWEGVPVYIRTGKNLPIRVTEVFVQFKKPLEQLFKSVTDTQVSNILAFRIQPNEGISLKVLLKEPGHKIDLKEISMDFCYSSEFKLNDNSYIRLLEDAIDHDKSLFTSIDEIIASWEFVEGMIAYKKNNPDRVLSYKVGTWGPEEANVLITKDGKEWHSLYPYKCDINQTV